MRTIVDLPEQQIESLKVLSQRAGLSRAELMRRAVADYLTRHPVTHKQDAFGLWKEHEEDGIAYQDRLRHEWDAL